MSLYQGQSIVNELETETETKTLKSKSPLSKRTCTYSTCTVPGHHDAAHAADNAGLQGSRFQMMELLSKYNFKIKFTDLFNVFTRKNNDVVA